MSVFFRNTDLQFRSRGHGWQKNENQRNHQIVKCKIGFTRSNRSNKKNHTNSSMQNLFKLEQTAKSDPIQELEQNIISVEWTEAATKGGL